MNSLGHKEAKVYSHISTGAAWSEAHLHDIGLSNNGTCFHCGGEASDITHVTWSCPVINKHRKVQDLKDLDPQLLPKFIKHGIPAAMPTDIEGALGGKFEQTGDQQISPDNLKAIGVLPPIKPRLLPLAKIRRLGML